MTDSDPEDVLSMGDAVDDEDIADLRAFLAESPNPEMRVQAANVLGEVGTSVGDPARTEIVDDLITVVLRDQNDEVRATAIDALHFLGGGTIDKLVDAIVDQFRRSQPDQGLTEHLTLWLTSSSSEFRIVGAAAMERFGDAAVVPTLEEAFSDQDPRVRARAARAYGSFGEQVSAEPLRSLLDDDRSLVRQAAARTLGSIQTEAAFEVLISAIQGDDDQLRLVAATQLGQFDSPEAVTVLLGSLVDRSQAVRYRAAVSLLGTLARTGRSDDVPSRLDNSFDDAEIGTVAETLFDVATDAHDEDLSRPRRAYAVWLLGELSTSHDDGDLSRLLVPILRTDEDAVSDLAAAYLKLHDGEEIERELQTLISDSAVSPAVQQKAKQILRRVKRNAAAPVVEQSIEYTYVQSPRDYTMKYDE